LQYHPSPLISAESLNEILNDPDVGVVDCRFSLNEPGRGERNWAEAAIPGAVYAHLDRDLSSTQNDPGQGRHPLPTAEQIRSRLASWGFSDTSLVVCYDDAGGPFAARLWWLLRWLGHEATVVLDGGWQAWLATGAPTEPGKRQIATENPALAPASSDDALLAGASDLLSGAQPVDARSRARYLGMEEPIDPVAGHIPGAVSMPWMENLASDGRFLPKHELAARWHAAGGTEHAICYCGSGVTACHNILAAAVAGLPLPRLYPPSWSGWIADPSHPVATGQET